MPPKKSGAEASKKTVQKKKLQVVDDKTFGLKNKNKSKKVQLQIESVKKNVMNSGDPKVRKLEEQRQKVKAEAKMRKKAQKDEQDALFNEALMAVSKKTSTSHKDGKVEAKGRDGDDDENNKKTTSRAMKMMFQMDAQEMNEKLREDVSCCIVKIGIDLVSLLLMLLLVSISMTMMHDDFYWAYCSAFSAPFSPYLTILAAPLAILFSCACHVLCVCLRLCVDTA